MGDNSFDIEYMQRQLQGAWKVQFIHEHINDMDIGTLHFCYEDKLKAEKAWDYVMFRLLDKQLFITLRINEKNELEVLLDVRELKIKLNMVYTNFNSYDLGTMIENGSLPFVDSIVNTCCQYYNIKTDKFEPYVVFKGGSPIGCIKSTIHRLDNDGFQLLPPPPLPSF